MGRTCIRTCSNAENASQQAWQYSVCVSPLREHLLVQKLPDCTALLPRENDDTAQAHAGQVSLQCTRRGQHLRLKQHCHERARGKDRHCWNGRRTALMETAFSSRLPPDWLSGTDTSTLALSGCAWLLGLYTCGSSNCQILLCSEYNSEPGHATGAHVLQHLRPVRARLCLQRASNCRQQPSSPADQNM